MDIVYLQLHNCIFLFIIQECVLSTLPSWWLFPLPAKCGTAIKNMPIADIIAANPIKNGFRLVLPTNGKNTTNST